MNQIISITASTIDGAQVQTVNARDLYAFLESKQDFSTWIKIRIGHYDFSEGKDFIRSEGKLADNNATVINYHISTDMAKELSMVERTEKGKIARQYFIDCERIAKSAAITPPPADSYTLGNGYKAGMILASVTRELVTTGLDIYSALALANEAAMADTGVTLLTENKQRTAAPVEAPKRKAPPAPVKSTEGYYTVAELARRKGTSVENVNILLTGNKLHVQNSNGSYEMKQSATTKKVGMRRLGVNLWRDTAFS